MVTESPAILPSAHTACSRTALLALPMSRTHAGAAGSTASVCSFAPDATCTTSLAV